MKERGLVIFFMKILIHPEKQFRGFVKQTKGSTLRQSILGDESDTYT